MALQTASAVRLAAFRSQCLSFAKSCSMGFRSGEYETGAKSAELPVRSQRSLNPVSIPELILRCSP